MAADINQIEKTGTTDLQQQSLRFLIFGALNTLVTYLVYCLLVFILHPQLAYIAAYLLGIVLAYLGNSKYVFRVSLRVRTAMIYPGIYVVQYACTAMLIYLLMEWFGLGPRIALAVALVVTVPVSFVMNRKLLGATSASQANQK